jgi:two-component system, NtrC family, response regulator HydG
MNRLLLLDDDITFTKILQAYLNRHGFEVEITHSVQQALKTLQSSSFDVLLLDYRLPDGTGIDVVESLSNQGKNFPSIMMTSFNDVRTAVQAMRSGVSDYILKPVHQEELILTIRNVMAHGSTVQDSTPVVSNSSQWVEATSDKALQLQHMIALVAPTPISVLIEGESGTGKEHVARTIHQKSLAAAQPFIAVDCGALSKELAFSTLFGHAKGSFTGAVQDHKGVFEQAQQGTLFLDEIGNLTYEIQVALLRVIQERVVQPLGKPQPVSVDIRILAATNEDLLQKVERGEFREDLYHRLNEFKIQVPPLRERKEDLERFVYHFINESNSLLQRHVSTLSDEVWDVLHAYDWPGNLRELKNVVKRMVLLTTGSEAALASLPMEMIQSLQNQPHRNEPFLHHLNDEGQHIKSVLERCRYNKTLAAKELNIDRSTLYQKIKKYGL